MFQTYKKTPDFPPNSTASKSSLSNINPYLLLFNLSLRSKSPKSKNVQTTNHRIPIFYPVFLSNRYLRLARHQNDYSPLEQQGQKRPKMELLGLWIRGIYLFCTHSIPICYVVTLGHQIDFGRRFCHRHCQDFLGLLFDYR
jgi:hypothetical protein